MTRKSVDRLVDERIGKLDKDLNEEIAETAYRSGSAAAENRANLGASFDFSWPDESRRRILDRFIQSPQFAKIVQEVLKETVTETVGRVLAEDAWLETQVRRKVEELTGDLIERGVREAVEAKVADIKRRLAGA